ncbi:DNA translocase FtsK [Salinisphaera sp.]|uniref:DNA translocase FtsK n=1 Tax=Salinisphaera sp. TaxID=1914330 RepID=UPI002D79214A|nr:DNA translocase FtsK 4TM domain-containing protein [Salinisphaera sp.]HET7313262.1 DNA translocase FtsK 4TM domain-containing protein [Salinisphaera sp.]
MTKAATKQSKGNASSKAAKAGPRTSSRAAANDIAEAPSAYRQRLGRLLREAALFIAMAITLFLLAALISYNPADPGWSDNGNGTAVHNLLGVPGAWFADVLLSLFGYLGFICPFMVLYGGWLIFVDRHRPSGELMSKGIRAGSLLLCLISACGLAWLMLGGIVSSGLPQGSGGIVGAAAARPLAGVIKMIGAAWALTTVFVITLSMGLGFSWLAVAERIGHFILGGAVNTAVSMVGRFGAWRADRAERAAQRAAAPPKSRPKKKPRKAPTLDTDTPAAPAAAPVAFDKPKKKGKNGKKKATQLDLPMDEARVDVPIYDPARDSPIPPIALLDPAREPKGDQDEAVLIRMSEQLEQHLADFNVQAKVVAVEPGPVVTRFEIDPAPGVKVNQISNLAKDLARAMSTTSVRVVEVIPGKSVVGLEIPNADREIVALREILDSTRYAGAASPLTLALGKDIGGKPVTADLAKMPHMLVAGTTGSGKSVAVNAMILSILHKATAEEVRLIMIDPKMLELSVYEGIPHLLAPVVTDMKDAANALRWCVGEMERRYKLMAALGVRNMAGFNAKVNKAIEAGRPITDPIAKNAQSNAAAEAGEELPTLAPLPAVVIIVDELADMMMVVGKKVEELIARIAQKARAAGLHMILATQRPSVDVITGLIKANIPTRIAFQVASKIDSRTILDQQGAESLLGHGDMLYLPPGTGFSNRVHGAFVDDHEVHKVVEYLKQTGQPDYIEEILEGGAGEAEGGADAEDDAEADPLYDQAVAIVLKSRKASISYVQRRLRVGYNRSARLIEQMENASIVGPAEGSGGREVLAPAPPDDD